MNEVNKTIALECTVDYLFRVREAVSIPDHDKQWADLVCCIIQDGIDELVSLGYDIDTFRRNNGWN